ncbi:hypothetical protein [Shimia haliotis]|uniref:Outer membrane protein beta-barrel domain-containing protein n=1 Tax=Shimia haliotis TaxID=1280847 RepID=A0A1I4B626_9RHOB|nr:hypothetical protein [Shimia haliotis]SFK63316.1 hypothetical protein SAMN04488036_101781 [Shimia haliotis]
MTQNFTMGLAVLSLVAGGAIAEESDTKLADDPTKVITKVGLSYSDKWTLSGSVAVGPVSKINVRLSDTGEWTAGGSYLFNFGIVNVSASQRELNSGVTQTQYSIGSYAPIYRATDNPKGWQVFAMFGANYTEGNGGAAVLDMPSGLSTEVESRGGYVGAMALKPISPLVVFKSFGVLSRGSNDYSGYGIGGGFTFNLSKRDTINVMAFYSDNSFGQNDSVSIGYRREF